MYYQQDTNTKEWFITRLFLDGSIRVDRITYKTKKAAIEYIEMCGFKPQKWEV